MTFIDIELVVSRAEYMPEEEFILFEFSYEGVKYLGQFHRSGFHDKGDVVSHQAMRDLAALLVGKKVKWEGFNPDLQQMAHEVAVKNGFR
jgi:hypothetical protein